MSSLSLPAGKVHIWKNGEIVGIFFIFYCSEFPGVPGSGKIQMNRARLQENCHGFCITLGA